MTSTLGQLLPRLSKLHSASAGHFEIDLRQRDSLRLVTALIDDVYETALADGLAAMEIVASDVLRDIIEARGEEDHPGCDFLQLMAAGPPLACCAALRRFDRAWFWATAAMADDLPEPSGTQIDYARLLRAVEADRSVALIPFLEMVGTFFYLAASAGYMSEAAKMYAPFSVASIIELVTVREHRVIQAAIHAVAYLEKFGPTTPKELVTALYELYVDERVSFAVRGDIACLLSGPAGRYLNFQSGEFAHRALSELVGNLDPRHEISLLCASVIESAESIRGVLSNLVPAIVGLNASMQAVGEGELSVRFGRARMFDMVAPLIATLCSEGDSKNAVRLISSWSGVSPDVSLEDALICLRLEDDVIWSYDGTVVRHPAGDVDLLRYLNEAFGLLLVDPEVQDEPVMPKRLGIPDEAAVERFLGAASAMLRPVDAVDLARAAMAARHPLVNLAMQHAPLPYLIQSVSGPAISIGVSLQSPLPDREIRLAQIWWGGVALAQEEAEGVAELLRRAGTTVKIYHTLDSQVDSFLESYRDPEVDLFWVSSHAELGHWDPDLTRLVLDEHRDVAVKMEDLILPRRPDQGRRLLVMNSCDGGSAAALGGPSTVGLAGIASSGNQAVVSHLWPTWYPAAMAFGVLLANRLCTEGDFREAFDLAMRDYRSGSGDAIRRLGLPKVVERLENASSIELAIHQASPVLFE